MATLRQIRSNRISAQASTGPKSPGSEGNGRTHGLSASKCIGEEEKRLIETRLADLEREMEPEGTLQLDEVRTIAMASVRIEQCQLEEETSRRNRAERAEFYWAEDRQAEAKALAQRLPAKPELVAAQLRQTLRGAAWMLAAWRDLARAVRGTLSADPARPLDEIGRQRACDLLGLSPLCRLPGSTPLDPPGGVASEAQVIAHQDALCARQILELEALTSEHMVALDESVRIETVHGSGPGIDAATRLPRRYESEARRVKDQALERFEQLKERAALVKEDAMKQERLKRWKEYLAAQERIDGTPCQDEPKAPPEVEPEPEPEAQPQPQQEAPAVAAKATPETAVAAAPAASADLEEALRLTVAQAASITLPSPAPLPLTRRARKAQAAAARAAHRKAG